MVKKEMKMHLMHNTVIIATMDVLVPVVRMVMYLTELEHNEQVRMARVLLTMTANKVYVYLTVRSFRAARRSSKDSTPEQTDAEPEQAEPADPQ